MFWVDQIAKEIIASGKYKQSFSANKPYWVDDMKTPSGRVHVGSLRGVVIHDLIYKALIDQGKKATYTYCINDMDPMDGFPVYLDRDKFYKYMGWPLFKIPSPEKGFSSFSQYFAQEFIGVFNKIGSFPQIIWTSDLYKKGKFDGIIKTFLDNTDKIRSLFRQQYQGFKEEGYYPYQPICPKCGRIATTKIYKWDGEYVYFKCEENAVAYTKGCGFEGKVKAEKLNGKMPWKIEWSAHWKTLGVTIEWSGKDHMTKGGSHEIASKISEEILSYPTPHARSYEHLLIGGRKMSSSKGLGSSSKEVSEILPPELLRFLMVRTDYHQAINFDPGGQTIPDLFDEYDRCGQEFWQKGKNSDFGRIYELSQVDPKKPEKPVDIRFRQIVQWIQMPSMAGKIKDDPVLQKRAKYAKIWLDKFAPESEKFVVKDKLPVEVEKLTSNQRQLLSKIAEEIDKDWDPEKLQNEIYKWGESLGLTSKQTFQAIYLALIAKDHGPKAAWLILSLDKKFVKKRFGEVVE